MRTGKVLLRILIIAVLAMFAASSVFAGTTGKIKGKVIDKKTKEPIPSATVMIEGTTMGALTGTDGEYMIADRQFDRGTYEKALLLLGVK